MENRSIPESKSGIYFILNRKNGHIYIGSAVNFTKRFTVHKANLNKNQHHCRHLQNAWNKYGSQEFEFIIVEQCKKEILEQREQFWLDNSVPEYNIARIAGSNQGIVFLPERRRKISEAQIRISNDPKEKKRRSNRLKQQWQQGLMNRATVNAHLAAAKKRKEFKALGLSADFLTLEQHKAIGEKNRGKKRSEESRKKISEGHKGKPWSFAQREARMRRNT